MIYSFELKSHDGKVVNAKRLFENMGYTGFSALIDHVACRKSFSDGKLFNFDDHVNVVHLVYDSANSILLISKDTIDKFSGRCFNRDIRKFDVVFKCKEM